MTMNSKLDLCAICFYLAGLHGPLRKGKWTNEEEKYANKIISYFNKGNKQRCFFLRQLFSLSYLYFFNVEHIQGF